MILKRMNLASGTTVAHIVYSILHGMMVEVFNFQKWKRTTHSPVETLYNSAVFDVHTPLTQLSSVCLPLPLVCIYVCMHVIFISSVWVDQRSRQKSTIVSLPRNL